MVHREAAVIVLAFCHDFIDDGLAKLVVSGDHLDPALPLGIIDDLLTFDYTRAGRHRLL